MSIFGEIPQTRCQKVIRSLCYFVLGACLGLFPAILALSAIILESGAHYFRIIGILLVIFCVPPGLIFMIFGILKRGEIISGIFKVLGRHVKSRPF